METIEKMVFGLKSKDRFSKDYTFLHRNMSKSSFKKQIMLNYYTCVMRIKILFSDINFQS